LTTQLEETFERTKFKSCGCQEIAAKSFSQKFPATHLADGLRDPLDHATEQKQKIDIHHSLISIGGI
tara:strand:- start:4444 stop:4644 length:201 start_codon:yes stop_codon:yes gene_type:complete